MFSLQGIEINDSNVTVTNGWIDASQGNLSITGGESITTTNGYLGSHEGSVTLRAGTISFNATHVVSETGQLLLEGSVSLTNGGYVTGKESSGNPGVLVKGDSLTIIDGSHLGLHASATSANWATLNPSSVRIESKEVTISAAESKEAGVDGTNIAFTGNSIVMTGTGAHFIASNDLTLGDNNSAGLIEITATSGGTLQAGKNLSLSATSAEFSGGAQVIGTAGVAINTPDLKVDDGSSVTSEGKVSIALPAGSTSEKLSIELDSDKDGDEGSIKGYSVVIGSSGQQAQTAVNGGSITATGADQSADKALQILGGSGGIYLTNTDLKSNGGGTIAIEADDEGSVSLDKTTADAGKNGSIVIGAGDGGAITIGTEGASGDVIDKDTQILGGNIVIGSADGSANADITVTDALIGAPDGTVDSSVTINAGAENEVKIDGSAIGTAESGKTSEAGKVTIGGGSVVIGSDKPTADGAGVGTDDKFDTAIGGNEIVIGGTGTGSVTVGNAEVGTGSVSDVTIEAGSQDSAGSITIGDADGEFNTAIAGGKVNIGSAEGSQSAQVDIKGSSPSGDGVGSSTSIKGDKIAVEGGSITIDDVDIALNAGDTEDKEINIAVSDDGSLTITDANIDATGGTGGTGNGSVQISGGTGTGSGSISGSNIASGGNAQFDGNLTITDSDIEAGVNVAGPGTGDQAPSGSVIFGDAAGSTESNIVIGGGSSIVGDGVDVNAGATVDLGTSDQDASDSSIFVNGTDGVVNINGGELNVGSKGDIYGEDDLTVNVGADSSGTTGTINVEQGASIVAGVDKDDSGNVSESADGGNLTISGEGDVNVNGGTIGANAGTDSSSGGSAGNVNIAGGDVNLSNGGTIEADGVVTVGGDDSQSGSINVEAGDAGTIIAKDEAGTGQGLVVNKGGIVSVDNEGSNAEGTINQGSLVVTKDPDKEQTATGGLTIDDDVQVSVGDGGYIASGDINFGNGSKLEIGNGGGLYTDGDTILDNAGKGDDSNLIFGFDSVTGEGADIQVSGDVSKEQLDQIRDLVGDNSSLVVDHVDGVGEGEVISKDELLNDYAGAVIGDAVIDVSEDNELSFGGGGSIMVDGDTLTIQKPTGTEPNTGVVITGSETDPSKEVVVGKNPADEGPFNIDLEDGADVTFGKDGAAGGTLSGSITATGSSQDGEPSDVNVVGGDFTIERDVNLANGSAIGDINIIDRNTANDTKDNGLAVAGDVTAGDLNMSGSDTNLDVGGSLNLKGDANLSGNADVDSAGKITVEGDLNLGGGSSVGSASEFGTASGEDSSLTVEGSLNVADNAAIDRGQITVEEDAYINGNGGVSSDGGLSAGGTIEIGTGNTAAGSTTQAGNPTVEVSNGNLTTGSGDLVIGQGEVNVNGAAGSADEGNIIVGSGVNGSGNLIVGNDGSLPKTPANVTASNDITVENGSATIKDNGNVSAGGAFVVGTGTDANAGNATVEGSLSASTAEIGKDLVIGADVADGSQAPSQNGSVSTSGSTDVAGNLVVNENGSLTVGSNPTGGDDGKLTVGGSMHTQAGSNVTANNGLVVGDGTGTDKNAVIGGSLTVGGASSEGAPNAQFNGDLTIEAGASVVNTGAVDGTTDTMVSGNLTVGSDAAGSQSASASLADTEVNGTSTISNAAVDAGNFTGHDDLTVNAGGSLLANGGDIVLSAGQNASDGRADLIVNGGSVVSKSEGTGESAAGGNITVGGIGSISSGSVTADGTLHIEGIGNGDSLVVGSTASDSAQASVSVGDLVVDQGNTVVNGNGSLASAGSAQLGGNLTVGQAGSSNVPNGSFTTGGSAAIEGNLVVNDNGELSIGTNPEDGQSGDLVVNGSTTIGSNATVDVGGNINFGAGAGGGEFALGEGSTITASGSVAFGEGSLANDSLKGFITAPSGLDLSGLAGPNNSAPVFSGSSAGFQTGTLTGDAVLENGANAVLTPQTGAETATINGWLTAAAGDASAGTVGSTITTNPEYKGTHADLVQSGSAQNAVIYMDSPMSFGQDSGLIVGNVANTPTESGIYFGGSSALVLNAQNMGSGTVLFQNGTPNGMPIHVDGATADNPVRVDMSGWLMGENASLVFNVDQADAGLFEFNSSNILQSFGVNFENGVGSIGMEVLDVSEVTQGSLAGDLADSVYQVTKLGSPDYVVGAYDKIFSKPSATPSLDPNGSAADKSKFDELVAAGLITKDASNVTVTDYGIGYVGADGKQYFRMNEKGNKTVKEVATFPVMSGAFNAAYDYLTEFNRAVETRALDERMHDRSNAVWAHVIATYNKSDELFDGSGYKADLYGGVLGADARLANGTLIGGALTVGTGDIESRGAEIGTQNDATFYGLSLYAEQALGAMALKGDVTYLRTENDIAGTFEGINMGGSMDTDAISVGVRAEFAAYVGEVFSVKPHIGLRYTNYSFENYRGTEVDDVNVLEAPVGVAFTGKVAADGGWTVVPELDLSVVPQMGDKEATVVNAGAGVDQRVLEGAVFNAKFGLGMQKDNFTFGANFQHGEGGYGRNNNAFQAYARWLF